MDEDLDVSEGARIFKALHEANLPPLKVISENPPHWGYYEFSIDPSKADWYVNPLYIDKVPKTEIQAVMESEPHQPPLESYEEKQHHESVLISAVTEVWETLTETEKWIYHMLVDVGLSMRFVALILDTSKTTFARRRDALAIKIKNELLRHQAVIDYLAKDLVPYYDPEDIDQEKT